MLESLSNKDVGLKAGNLIKKGLQHMFSCAYCVNFKNSFFYRTPPVAVFISWMNGRASADILFITKSTNGMVSTKRDSRSVQSMFFRY